MPPLSLVICSARQFQAFADHLQRDHIGLAGGDD